MDIQNEIKNYVSRNEASIIEDISTLVAIKSITGHTDETSAALNFLLSKATSWGMRTATTTQKDVGVVEIGPEDEDTETVGMLVHIDVVDIGDLDKWTNDPFTVVESDGLLFGRGTTDDKGPAVMSLYALKALLDLQIPINKKIQLIIGTSEEENWTDIEHYKEQFKLPDYGFSPDGEFPIYNEEHGYADVVLHFAIDAGDGAEITKLQAGNSVNTIPSKAVIQLSSEDEVEFHGQAAHSSLPEIGDNAILKLCATYKQIQGMSFCKFINDHFTNEKQSILPEGTIASPTILRLICNQCMDSGTTPRMTEVCESPQPQTLSSQTPSSETPSFWAKSQNPALALELNVNIRQKFGVTEADIIQAFNSFSERYDFTYEINDCLDPMQVDANLPFLDTMLEVYKSYNLPGDFATARGSTYAKSVNNFVSWGPLFPGDPDRTHAENECLPLKSMRIASELYISYLVKINEN
jgi:succinyl-diaminopimelate desuccinylase